MTATLATAGGSEVQLWNVPGGSKKAGPFRMLADGGGERAVTCMTWGRAAQQQIAVATSWGYIGLYSGSGELECSLSSVTADGRKQPEYVGCAAFSSSAHMLGTGGSEQVLKLWDIETKEVAHRLTGHTSHITCCSFGEKDTVTISGSRGGDLMVHNISSGAYTHLSTASDSHGKTLCAAQFSPFRKGMAASGGEESCLQLWDAVKGTKITQFTNHKACMKGLAFSPVNELLLCSAGLDRLLLFYDVQANKLVKSIKCDAALHSLDFMNDGFTVAAGTANGTVVVYDLRTLGAGANPSSTFSAHAPSPVVGVQFQHVPPKPKKSVYSRGKENSAPAPPAVVRGTREGSAVERSAERAETRTAASSQSALAPADTAIFSPVGAKAQEVSPVDPAPSRSVTHSSANSSSAAPPPPLIAGGVPESSRGEGSSVRFPDRSHEGRSSVKGSERSRDGSSVVGSERSRADLMRDLERMRTERVARSSLDSANAVSGDAVSSPHAPSTPLSTPTQQGLAGGSVFSPAAAPSPKPVEDSGRDALKQSPIMPSQVAALKSTVRHANAQPSRSDLSVPSSVASSRTPTQSDVSGHVTRRSTGGVDASDASRQTLGYRSAGVESHDASRQATSYPTYSSPAASITLPRDLTPTQQLILEESLSSFKEAVQNMHLDMIRQFHMQQQDFRAMMDEVCQRNKSLEDEVVALRHETQMLRNLY